MNINMTLIGQTIAFAIFVWFCIKYVWPPISNALHERQRKIAEGLDAASRATRDLELAEAQVNELMNETKQQASEILEQANKRSAQMVEEAREQARQEGERIVANAKAEIDQEINRAKDSLREQVSRLAIQGAEQVLGSSIDEKKHAKLVDNLAKEL